MRNDYDRALICCEEALKPLGARNIKVIGRLVEQQELRPAEQQLAHAQLRLLTTAEFIASEGEIRLGEAETDERRPCSAAVGQPAL